MIDFKNSDPLTFAGLWEHWEGQGETIGSCTIIVTKANEMVSEIHDRMPVILLRESYDGWLDSDVKDPKRLQELLKPSRWSLGSFGARDADLHTDGQAGAACRWQVPTPIGRDYPLRATEKVVYTAYTPW